MIKTSLNNQNQFNVCLLFIFNQNLKQRKVTVKVNCHYQIPKFLILMMSLTQDQQCKILDSDEEFSLFQSLKSQLLLSATVYSRLFSPR